MDAHKREEEVCCKSNRAWRESSASETLCSMIGKFSGNSYYIKILRRIAEERFL